MLSTVILDQATETKFFIAASSNASNDLILINAVIAIRDKIVTDRTE